MRRTDLPAMQQCDGCRREAVPNACCTIVKARPQEAKAIRHYMRDNGVEWRVNPGIQCGFLQEGQCAIYPVRPWVCRAFGVVKQLPCHRFPQEAVVDIPVQEAYNRRLSDPNDDLLGWYFEPGYYQRMKRAVGAPV